MCFQPSGPLPMLVQTMKEFDYADKIQGSCTAAFWPTGYPAPDHVPKSDEGIVSGTGVTGVMFLRITQKLRILLQSMLPRPRGLCKCCG